MLNQAEIDALLSGTIETEDTPDKQGVNLAQLAAQPTTIPHKNNKGKHIRPYNFWSPDRFSKEQMRAIEMMHEDLVERLTTSLPPFLRVNLQPRVVLVEQGRFHDLLRDLAPGSLFHLIALPPLPGLMVLTISSKINDVILEQRLGGQAEQAHQQQELTQIDQMLLRGLAEHILSDIKAAWSKIVAIEPRVEDSTTNYHWVQMSMGNEKVMLVAFEMIFQDATGTMNVYIPFNMLKPIAGLLKPHIWLSMGKERQPDIDAHQDALKRLSQITVPLRVILGNANLTVGELANLRPGDVLPLNTSVQQALSVQVVDNTRFLAHVGLVGKHLAVQITSIITNSDSTPDNGSKSRHHNE